MKASLKTTDSRPEGIFSDFYLNGTHFCKTLEHAFPSGEGWMPKLPRNWTYTCKRGTHQLDHGDPFVTFEITGVPGHSGILFHVGNFNKDSDGCVLQGAEIVKDAGWWISHSRLTFQAFMHLLEGVDSFELEVS